MTLTPIRRNVAANLVGRAWVALLGFVFIPVYLHFLGIEAYGLVGVFATLQAIIGILDLGIGATINRELARHSTNVTPRREQQIVLRTFELIYWCVAVSGGGLVVLLAPVLAEHWIYAERLPASTVERSLRLMGLGLGLQLQLSFYQAALMGLQRQVALNAVGIAGATTRGLLTALVLWQVSPSIEAFFICQAAITALQLALTCGVVWAGLGGFLNARPDFVRVAAVWRFAAATSANSIVGLMLTQLDKVLLSRLLPLGDFAYYALATTLASVVWAIVVPVNQALFPRFAQLFELRDEAALTALYHRASQALVVAVVPAAATVAAFSWHVMWLWTRNPATADQTALIAALLIAGTAINGLSSIPGHVQAAAGWPQLMLYTNVAAAILLVPAILVVVPQFGGPGAAAVWVVLNIGYLVFNVPLMHRRLMSRELWGWYRDDVAMPTVAATAIVLLGRWMMPQSPSTLATAAWIVVVWFIAVLAAAAFAARLRPVLFRRTPAREVPVSG